MIQQINAELTQTFKEIITGMPWALIIAIAFPIALIETIRKYRW